MTRGNISSGLSKIARSELEETRYLLVSKDLGRISIDEFLDIKCDSTGKLLNARRSLREKTEQQRLVTSHAEVGERNNGREQTRHRPRRPGHRTGARHTI